MRHPSCKHRKMKPQEWLLTVILCTSIVTASPIQYKYTRIPDCDYLENDGTQHNAMELPNKFCCFCGKGKYFADFCNDQDPKSTVCLNCTYTEDYKSYIDYEPHILEKCTMQEPCMPGKIEVNGSRSQKSSCICPDGMVEVDRHCEPENIHVPTPTQNLIISPIVTSSGDKTGESLGEETKYPKTDAVTDKPVEPTNSLSETMATETENTSEKISTPKIDQSVDITNSPGSTLATTSQNQKDFDNDPDFAFELVYKIIAVVFGIFFLSVGILCLVRCIRKKSPGIKRYNIYLDVIDSVVRFENDGNSSGNAEEEDVGETLPMINDSNSSVNATESYASDSLQSINTGNSNPIDDTTESSDLSVFITEMKNESEEKSLELVMKGNSPSLSKAGPIEQRTGIIMESTRTENQLNNIQVSDDVQTTTPACVNQDQSEPAGVVTEIRTENSSPIGETATSTAGDGLPNFVINEQPQSSIKAVPIEERPGPQIELPEVAGQVNNPPGQVNPQVNNPTNAIEEAVPLLSQAEKQKRARVLGKWEAKIAKRDLPKIARKLLPQDEHDFIEEMMEKNPYDKEEAAHQIFERVQQVNSNLSLQEMLPVVEGLGYLRDILLSEM